MTYKELLEKLKRLSPEQLNTDVTVYACDENFSWGDEYFPLNDLLTSDDKNDILDPDHPYLIFYK